MPRSLTETLTVIIILIITMGVIGFSWDLIAEERNVKAQLPARIQTADAFADLVDAECIAGSVKYSFDTTKLDSISGGSIPCFRDASVTYWMKIYSPTKYYGSSKEWIFKGSRFQNTYLKEPEDHGKLPMGLYQRGILLEKPDGSRVPGFMVLFLVTDLPVYVELVKEATP